MPETPGNCAAEANLSQHRSLAGNALAKLFEKFPRHHTGLPVPDRAGIDLHNWDDLSSRAGKKELIGNPNIIAGEVGLAPGDTDLVRNIQYRIAGNALERSQLADGVISSPL